MLCANVFTTQAWNFSKSEYNFNSKNSKQKNNAPINYREIYFAEIFQVIFLHYNKISDGNNKQPGSVLNMHLKLLSKK